MVTTLGGIDSACSARKFHVVTYKSQNSGVEFAILRNRLLCIRSRRRLRQKRRIRNLELAEGNLVVDVYHGYTTVNISSELCSHIQLTDVSAVDDVDLITYTRLLWHVGALRAKSTRTLTNAVWSETSTM